MKLTFLGTRGYIDERSRKHRRHTSMMVAYRGRRVRIDCGLDWKGKADLMNPAAIIITHAHPDHVDGLKDGAPCPVYATRDAWKSMESFQIDDRRTIIPRRRISIAGIDFQAWPLEHSLRCPAVGYRISAGRSTIFYSPDVLSIPQRERALRDVRLYIGDGATVTRPLVQRKNGRPIGHTSMRAQVQWCIEQEIDRVIFTHCGTEVVTGSERKILARLREATGPHEAQILIASDGMELVLR